ncbi:MAG: hypothetical protein WBO24_04735 [Nitrospirales bacterium]
MKGHLTCVFFLNLSSAYTFPGSREEAGRSDCLWEGLRLDSPHEAPEQPARRKKFDPIVIMGLSILIGGIFVISLGMFLSRPDRSIPPYSIGAQEGSLVAVHVPPYTSDPEIQTLVRRFGDVGRATRDFADMKIRPTTPDDPRGRYQTLQIIIFSDPFWTEPDNLHRYVANGVDDDSEKTFRENFEAAVRAGYRADAEGQAGWIGPWNRSGSTDRTLTMQWVFQETWEEASPHGQTSSPAP